MSTQRQPSAQEMRRILGGEMLLRGDSPREVAEALNVTEATVYHWKKRLGNSKGDLTVLSRQPNSGRPPKISPEQKQQLDEMICKGAVANGFENEQWTSKRVMKIIARTFGVVYNHRYVCSLLRELRFSVQKPVKKSRKHSPEAIKRWQRSVWPRLKKSA